MHLFAVGEYDETLIVAGRVVSIQGEMEIDRAGNLVMYSSRLEGKPHPKLIGSLVSLDNGTTIPVPQTPAEVGRRMSEAVLRQTVMPSG